MQEDVLVDDMRRIQTRDAVPFPLESISFTQCAGLQEQPDHLVVATETCLCQR